MHRKEQPIKRIESDERLKELCQVYEDDRENIMTSDIITLIQELGFPVAISVGLAFALYSVVRFILKEKVEDTLKRFDEKHENLQHRLDIIKGS